MNKQNSSLFRLFRKIFPHFLRITLPIILLLILFHFVLAVHYSTTESMEPTLSPYDIAVFNKLAYVQKSPQRGDIIVFRMPDTSEYYCKRIIAIGGDEVEFIDGSVYLNGKKIDESAYLPTKQKTYCMKKFKVPANHYFLLGDNRDVSFDSRYWAYPYITVSDIEGKYLCTLPFQKNH